MFCPNFWLKTLFDAKFADFKIKNLFFAINFICLFSSILRHQICELLDYSNISIQQTINILFNLFNFHNQPIKSKQAINFRLDKPLTLFYDFIIMTSCKANSILRVLHLPHMVEIGQQILLIIFEEYLRYIDITNPS